VVAHLEAACALSARIWKELYARGRGLCSLFETSLRPLPVPIRERVQPFLRDERIVGPDGFVAWERSWYGVPWRWAGKTVRVGADATTVEMWSETEHLAVHPRATAPGSG
jgi:Mu transposase-like protein